jgi:hypothetical protein
MPTKRVRHSPLKKGVRKEEKKEARCQKKTKWDRINA